MPIYEYRCGACERAFERLVYGSEAIQCPTCHSPSVTRLLSLFGMKTGQGFVSSAGGAGGATGGGCGCGRGGCGCH